MSNKKTEIYIIAAVRSPVGKLNGALSALRPDDLAVQLIHQLLPKAKLSPQKVDSIILGCANQAGEDTRNLARRVGLLAGLPNSTTALTINSLCASGIDAILAGIRSIFCGENDLVLVGGIESMSRSPWIESKTEATKVNSMIGWRFTNPKMPLICPTLSMSETAELLANKYHISQEMQDQYAFESRWRYQKALEKGIWQEEIIPFVDSKNKCWTSDEQHRILSLKLLKKLPKLVKNGQFITSGNAAHLGDGGALLALASKSFVQSQGIQPLARVQSWATAAVSPSLMGVAAVAACRKLFHKEKIAISDIDWVELSESFAVQSLACIQQLGLDPLKTNPNGGAISIGNPIATGSARLVVSLAHQMKRNSTAKRGLVASSAGLGIGTAILLEQ